MKTGDIVKIKNISIGTTVSTEFWEDVFSVDIEQYVGGKFKILHEFQPEWYTLDGWDIGGYNIHKSWIELY